MGANLPQDVLGEAVDGPEPLASAGSDYDLLPYPSMPITRTRPAHLAALAALFGLAASAPGCAHVLELGCASGGNIIPLAAQYPSARFTGLDLSARHIEDGRKRVIACGLGNISLQQADLARFVPDARAFDYVICHGVFSWVPRPVQDAILRICRDALAPNGLVAISYNVLPGWHLRTVVRDICLHYAGAEDGPQRRVARARAALEQIAQASPEHQPYGMSLRAEARRLRHMPAAYILGEFLASDNAPCTVQDFIARAGRSGLDYLCEADLSASVPRTLDPALQDCLASIGTGRAAVEQRIDFLTGRTFRCSVLVRQPTVGRGPMPSAERLGSLHVASPLHLDAAGSTDAVAMFRDGRGSRVSTSDPMVRQALISLEAAYPATVGLDELAAVSASDTTVAGVMRARIGDALLPLVLFGQASVSSLPLHVGRAADERPRVWAFARMEAASGQPWVTSLCHVGVPVYPVLRALLPYLDGLHDRAALRRLFIDAMASGTIEITELPADHSSAPAERLDQLYAPAERLDAIAEHHVEQTLRFCAQHALFEPQRQPYPTRLRG